jgi:hypothetical protein
MQKYIIEIDSISNRLTEVGPLIPGSWSRQHDELGEEIAGEFLIDTGAYGAMIDLDVAEVLRLSPQGARDVHGIHGYGRLQQYLGRVSLPARDTQGKPAVFTEVIECVGVPSLRDKNREHRADVIGILGRMFLRNSRFTIDNESGRVELQIYGRTNGDPQ